jgi:ubiquinone/menaquinone biosynthesis C-methylase UbiE
MVAPLSHHSGLVFGESACPEAQPNGRDAGTNRAECGQRVLEFGPGPGRLLLPSAERVLPGGQVVGVELQSGMVDRLKRNAARRGITNLTVIPGDATVPLVEEGTFDLVLLSCALGEIPDRVGVIRQAFRALRAGGRLSVSEMFGDPHYQSRTTVERLAREAGFEPETVLGGWFMFTANFRKPDAGSRI